LDRVSVRSIGSRADDRQFGPPLTLGQTRSFDDPRAMSDLIRALALSDAGRRSAPKVVCLPAAESTGPDISRRRDRLTVKSESNRCRRLRVVAGSVRNEAYTGVRAEKLEVSRRPAQFSPPVKKLLQSLKNWRHRCGAMSVNERWWSRRAIPSIQLEGMRRARWSACASA
jgi:hypothetical protein